MKLPKKLLFLIALVSVVIFFVVFAYLFLKQIKLNKPQINFQAPQTKKEEVVNYVIDGDTIKIPSGEKVRYIGMNTPETDECFGTEATKENKKLVEQHKVILVKDVSETDKYGRLLRYVYVENCDQIVSSKYCESNNTLFVNKYLLQNGFATLMQIKPDTKYYDKFKKLEKQAKESNVGLWKHCRQGVK